jgi:hypothetical protein
VAVSPDTVEGQTTFAVGLGAGGGTLSSSGARLAPEIEAYERGYRDGREEEGRGCGSMRSPRLLVEVPAGACIVAPGPLTVMR